MGQNQSIMHERQKGLLMPAKTIRYIGLYEDVSIKMSLFRKAVLFNK